MTKVRPETKVSWEQTRGFRLHRMHLVDPLGPRSLRKVAKALGGIQAQVHSAAELQFAARLNGLREGALERALYQSKTLVKTWMMRGTIHYLDPDDLPVWTAASETRQTWHKAYWQKSFGVTASDVRRALGAIDEVIGAKPLTREALADEVHRRSKNDAFDELMRQGWGSVLKIAAAEGLLCFGALHGRNVTFVRPESWLGQWRRPSVEASIVEVLRRYLASHAPATREEFARWWGFKPADARKVLEAMGDEILMVDRTGEKAYVLKRDLESLRNAAEDERIRLLGMFDAYTLAGLPNDQIVAAADKAKVYRTGAWVSQVVMRGGRIVGTWKHERKATGTIVEVALFPRQKITRQDVEDALRRLQPFLGEISRLRI